MTIQKSLALAFAFLDQSNFHQKELSLYLARYSANRKILLDPVKLDEGLNEFT